MTADHGQTDRGHHGGHEDEQQDFALYYFGKAKGPKDDTLLDQLQLAPTVLKRLGVPVPATMKAKPFLISSDDADVVQRIGSDIVDLHFSGRG